MKLAGLPYFSQKDSRWKNTKLGTSTVCTIGSDGCLLCDVTSICNYYGKEVTPDVMNELMKKNGGFVSGALLVYGAVTDIYPDIKIDWDNFIDCSTIPAPLDKIDKILFSKRPVIVKVDYDTGTTKVDQHWVTIIGKTEDGAYNIYDPIDGSEQFFQSRYGDPVRYIFKIVTYTGTPNNTSTDADTISELQTKIKLLNEQVANLSLENNGLRDALTSEENDNKTLQDELTKARGEKTTLSWEKEQIEIKAKSLEKEIEGLKGSVTSKEEALKAVKMELVKAKSIVIQDVGLWEFLYLKFLK